nr:hypothetical protein CFP56_72835 [Quercus suber]
MKDELKLEYSVTSEIGPSTKPKLQELDYAFPPDLYFSINLVQASVLSGPQGQKLLSSDSVIFFFHLALSCDPFLTDLCISQTFSQNEESGSEIGIRRK